MSIFPTSNDANSAYASLSLVSYRSTISHLLNIHIIYYQITYQNVHISCGQKSGLFEIHNIISEGHVLK